MSPTWQGIYEELQMSIIEAHGWNAIYGRGGDRTRHKPLVAWREDVDGSIVGVIDDEKGHLIDCRSIDGFRCYERPPRFWVIPAQPGWWSVWRDITDADGDKGMWEPIIAWIVDDRGFGLGAVSAPDSGGYEASDQASENMQFVYQPDRHLVGDGPWSPNRIYEEL